MHLKYAFFMHEGCMKYAFIDPSVNLSITDTLCRQLISAVVMKDWTDILTSCDLANWKEALAAVMTYARPDEFSAFCGQYTWETPDKERVHAFIL